MHSRQLMQLHFKLHFILITLDRKSLSVIIWHPAKKTNELGPAWYSIADSRTKNNHTVIQSQKAPWRKLEPLLGRNKKLYSLEEVKEYAVASEGKSCRPETKTTVNRYVCHDLSMWNRRLNQNLPEHNLPSRRGKKVIGASNILA